MKFSILRKCAVGIFLAGLIAGVRGQYAAPSTALDYFLVITGGELLAGVYPDAHTHYITRTLAPLGGHCVGSISVDDRPEDIKDALRLALARAPLAIVTGGLGPTENDITRQTLSSFTGIPLIESADLVQEMERRHKTPREQLRPNMRRQATIPQRGTYLPCPNGTAAGLVFDLTTNVIVALPGPPRELQPMVKTELVPWLVKRYGIRPQACVLTMRFVGAGQSLISQTLKDRVPLAPDVMQTSLFEGGRVDYTFSLPGDTPENRARLKAIELKVEEQLKAYVYSDDGSSLEDFVVQHLRERQVTLSLMEIGSGGAVASALSTATNYPNVLNGAYVAASIDAMARLLGKTLKNDPAANPLEELARQGQTATKSKWVLALGEIQKEPGKPVQIPVCLLKDGATIRTARFTAPSSDPISRVHLVTQVLDFLRKE